MPSRCYGNYLVYTECSNICLATIWCTLNAWNLYFVSAKSIVETTQQRITINPKRIVTEQPLYMPADAK